jgi:putative hydrolase of HD superfamily
VGSIYNVSDITKRLERGRLAKGEGMVEERLESQMAFAVEIGKLKQVLRRTITIDADRHENDAEHSWHLATMAWLLVEYAGEDRLDLLRIMKMVLIHDIVEIDAGDTYCYDETARVSQLDRESRAAARIFPLLPPDQARELRSLWDEFEAGETPEAKFAVALDRLQPLLLNYHTSGRTWKQHGVTSEQVRRRIRPVRDSSPVLWQYASQLVRKAVEEGLLSE